jgi:hypothetical protein
MDQGKNYLIIIGPGGQIEEHELVRVPNLDALQKAVGGYIEVVPYFTKYEGRPCIALCNENGKIEGLPVNRKAQAFWELSFGRPITEDHLVGSIAIVVGSPQFLEQM